MIDYKKVHAIRQKLSSCMSAEKNYKELQSMRRQQKPQKILPLEKTTVNIWGISFKYFPHTKLQLEIVTESASCV